VHTVNVFTVLFYPRTIFGFNYIKRGGLFNVLSQSSIYVCCWLYPHIHAKSWNTNTWFIAPLSHVIMLWIRLKQDAELFDLFTVE